MTIKQVVKWGKANPEKLFLIDAFGALLSAFLLGIVLVKFEQFFGIPIPILYFLALLPCFFAVYDFSCFVANSKNVGVLLKCIAFMNTAYCFVSLTLLLYHYERMKILGWSYILIEVIIVLILANIEYKVATAINSIQAD